MITIALSLGSLMLAGATAAQDDERLSPAVVAQVLAESAASVSLPQQIDPTTKLVSVRASGTTMIYAYELNEHGTATELRRYFARTNLPKICADEDMVYTLRQGALFRYSYVLLDEPEPVVIDVTLADCQN